MHWSVLISPPFLIDLAIAFACIVTGAGCVLMIRIANRQDRRREYDARALVDAVGGDFASAPFDTAAFVERFPQPVQDGDDE